MPVEPAPLTPAQLEELQARAAKADETWERLVQTTADFENFKKRAARERQDAARFANESLVQKLIPVLDNFEMALGAARRRKAEVRSPTSDLRPPTSSVDRRHCDDSAATESRAGRRRPGRSGRHRQAVRPEPA